MSKNYELLRGSRDESPRLKSHLIAQYPRRPGGYSISRAERATRGQDLQSPSWLRLFSILRKRWQLSAIFAVCAFLGVATATLLMKPLYEPTVTLEIDPPGTQAFSLERGSGDSNDAQYLETQAKTFQSDELALAVIRNLHLDQNGEFVANARPYSKLARKMAPKESVVQLTSSEYAALMTFRVHLKVHRDTGSRLVNVSFASHDPRAAAQIANALVNEFIANNFRTRHEAIVQTSAWLSRQLDDIRGRMDQTNHAVVEFQKKTGVADLDSNNNTVAERMAELNRQLASAQGERIQLEALLSKAQNGSSEWLPQTGENPVVQQLSQKLAETRADLSQAQVEYGKHHPALKKLRNQVDQLQADLVSQKRAIFERLQTAYAAAQMREGLLERERERGTKQLNQLAQYNTLKKESQTESELYNSLYARVKEAGIAAASNSYNVRIIDHAQVLRQPSEPRIFLNLSFGLIAALFGGVMIACISDVLDNRIHSSEDILNATGIGTVSVLPLITENNSAHGGGGRAQNLRGKPDHCVPKFLLERPNSAEAEAVRALYTTVMLSQAGMVPRVLLVVSGFAGEGKTTVASNLALALAQRGPTCLADADLRKSGVSHTFGFQSRAGLADLLSGSAALEDVIKQVPDVANLTILPSGRTHQNAGELMVEETVFRVLTELRSLFHFVVLDSPPILPYTDGRVLSTLVDGLIFVGRNGMTTRAAMTRSMEVLAEIHAAPILGVVLNAADSTISDYEYHEVDRQSP